MKLLSILQNSFIPGYHLQMWPNKYFVSDTVIFVEKFVTSWAMWKVCIDKKFRRARNHKTDNNGNILYQVITFFGHLYSLLTPFTTFSLKKFLLLSGELFWIELWFMLLIIPQWHNGLKKRSRWPAWRIKLYFYV